MPFLLKNTPNEFGWFTENDSVLQAEQASFDAWIAFTNKKG